MATSAVPPRGDLKRVDSSPSFPVVTSAVLLDLVRFTGRRLYCLLTYQGSRTLIADAEIQDEDKEMNRMEKDRHTKEQEKNSNRFTDKTRLLSPFSLSSK